LTANAWHTWPIDLPVASITSAARSFLMICSGLCFLPFIESLLAQKGARISHNIWISFRGAVQLHLAAIRAFFHVLVQRHAIGLNPALSVKTERYSALEGRTPEITVEQSRQLLASIKLKQPIDYRDRAIIAILIYTAVREGAVAALRRQDLLNDGTQFLLRFHEKGGKLRQIPVRHDLQGYLHEYLCVGGFEESWPAPGKLIHML
jgi:site-specific recombinase XerC